MFILYVILYRCLKLVYLHVCLLSYLWFYCIMYQIKWNSVTGQYGRTVVLLNAITLYRYIWKKKYGGNYVFHLWTFTSENGFSVFRVFYVCWNYVCTQGNMGEQPVAECFTLFKYIGNKKEVWWHFLCVLQKMLWKHCCDELSATHLIPMMLSFTNDKIIQQSRKFTYAGQRIG